ncbi:hypothetical protein SAMN04488025_11345 [Planifilum fulgidum]|uniref:Uncharacterized protein n=1 Tax=Planifilum fulgidum TaxID=201973 RepID=A0A1I2NI84_9BACL|nr:hypothetical protein SAMN04488025_11345 [Planifilum fulgidum]
MIETGPIARFFSGAGRIPWQCPEPVQIPIRLHGKAGKFPLGTVPDQGGIFLLTKRNGCAMLLKRRHLARRSDRDRGVSDGKSPCKPDKNLV